jgi:ABC-type Fe3+ transport system substrate-binding protein
MSTERRRVPNRVVALAMVAVVALGACAPAARPAAAPSAPPAAPGAAGASEGAGAPSDWDKTVAAAKQEGQLTLSGPPGQLWRDALVAFEKDYPGIRVEFTGQNSRDFWPRLFQERGAGQYLWDLRVGGPDPQVFQARDEGVLDPVRPLLALPEVIDESKWFGGFAGLYADKEQQFLPAFVAQAQSVAYVNRALISEAELSSDAQLREPRWRGKIAITDPNGGAGLGTLTTLYVAFGEDYVRDLLAQQDLVVTGDNRQLAEWVIRGRYPIGIGIAGEDLVAFERQGVSFNVQGMPPARKLSLGFGGIQLMNQAPHPNASKVFINWLLTQSTQANLAKTLELNSRRTDVPPGNAEQVLDPSRMADYVPHQYETYLPQRQRAQQMGKDLLVK